jgi:uncharacterized protein (DUF2252 family)
MKAKQKQIPAPKERAAVLNERHNLKMARSAHAYVRGNTANFYEWLETAKGRALPDGPGVWICGDCHVGNLGPIANAKGHVAVQIRDLDQTVIGNPAHDLIRLGLSLATAARGSDLPGVTTALMLEHMMEGYAHAFDVAKDGAEVMIDRPESVEIALKSALKRKWKHLARERIEDEAPSIPLGKKFWPLTREEKKEIEALFATEEARKLVTSLRSRDDDAQIHVLDAAYWMKGCSSLGNLRFAVLIAIGESESELCLMDIKEASQALAPRYPKVAMPKDNAERIVSGAQHLSPFLGNRMLAARLLGRAVFVRELMPQDMQLEIEQLTQEEAMKVAHFLAMVTGKAHARQMDEPTRQKWQAELMRNRTKTLDAPSWLWTSIVELVASHETAYLEHCRRYALREEVA